VQGRDGKPDQVKLILASAQGAEYFYGVTIGDYAGESLKPLIPTAQGAMSEAAIRAALVNVGTTKRWAKTYGSWVQDFLAGPGEHFATLHNLRQYKGAEATKWWLTLKTREGLIVPDFPAPLGAVQCIKGDTPDKDWLGPKEVLHYGRGPFYYLVKLGLDWEWFKKQVATCPAIWPGRWDEHDVPIDPLFSDIEDMTPEFLAWTWRTPKVVKVSVVVDPKYGLGVKRGKTFFELAEVVIEGAASAEFEREKSLFYDAMDKLTATVLQKDTRFMAGSETTPDGKAVIRGVLVPIIKAHPALVKTVKDDGSPAIKFPVTQEGWSLNGLAAVTLAVERLLKLDPEALFLNVSLTDPAPLLAWCNAHAPELAADMTVDEIQEEEY
jgi:hypothetical protein